MLEEKIKKVMYSLTIHYKGNHDFWVSRGFQRLYEKNKNGLYEYWFKKASTGDPELLATIDRLWEKHVDLDFEKLQKQNSNNKSSYPSLITMAKNITKSTANFIKGGMKIVTDEQLQERLKICNNCDNFDAAAFKGTGRCKLCGCSTMLKLKMATEKCPIDKWLAIN
jgi:hypothetical protein